MADLVSLSLQRKLATAEASGNEELAKRLRARMGGGEDEPQSEPDSDGDDLDAVPFASPAARSAAEEAGLEPKAFKRRRKSSESGFTKADVEKVAESAGGEDT
jgi:hypothetical protein